MEYVDLLLETLIDSAIIFGIAFVINFALSFLESKIAKLLEQKKRVAPIFGSIAGVIPQCGISVVGADLYNKGHLTIGTVVAIFIACSDEAIPVLLGNIHGKWWMTFVLIVIKVVIGMITGLLVDLIFRKRNGHVKEHLDHCEGEDEVHIGCCGHHIEEDDHHEESKLHEHFIHPLIHSLKIFAYVYVVSYAFGALILWVGEDNIASFLAQDGMAYWFTPIFSVLVGLIPNCASSVLISNLYIESTIPFGALLAGLMANAGLGTLMLFKHKENIKNAFLVLGIVILVSTISGYAFMWIA